MARTGRAGAALAEPVKQGRKKCAHHTPDNWKADLRASARPGMSPYEPMRLRCGAARLGFSASSKLCLLAAATVVPRTLKSPPGRSQVYSMHVTGTRSKAASSLAMQLVNLASLKQARAIGGVRALLLWEFLAALGLSIKYLFNRKPRSTIPSRRVRSVRAFGVSMRCASIRTEKSAALLANSARQYVPRNALSSKRDPVDRTARVGPRAMTSTCTNASTAGYARNLAPSMPSLRDPISSLRPKRARNSTTTRNVCLRMAIVGNAESPRR
jgi:hypothetical protein